MRVWFDTEFIEDGRTIDLISIGLIGEDGIGYYAESSECNLSKAGEWVAANVIPHLRGGKSRIPRARIASEILRIVGSKPEFWAYYADYDWVALCQLFGTMTQLPKGWPMYCRDVKQLCDSMGNQHLPPQLSAKHNALNDAAWARDAWTFLTERAKQPGRRRLGRAPRELMTPAPAAKRECWYCGAALLGRNSLRRYCNGVCKTGMQAYRARAKRAWMAVVRLG